MSRPKPDAAEYYRTLKNKESEEKVEQAQKAIREKLGMGEGNRIEQTKRSKGMR